MGFAIVGCDIPITIPLYFSPAEFIIPISQMDEAVNPLTLFNYADTVFDDGIVGLISRGNLKLAMIFSFVTAVLPTLHLSRIQVSEAS